MRLARYTLGIFPTAIVWFLADLGEDSCCCSARSGGNMVHWQSESMKASAAGPPVRIDHLRELIEYTECFVG